MTLTDFLFLMFVSNLASFGLGMRYASHELEEQIRERLRSDDGDD